MVSDKNENFYIYLITVFIQLRNKKVKKMGVFPKFFKFHERGSWDEKVLNNCSRECVTDHRIVDIQEEETEYRAF
jgi:hypothetical protein